MHYIILEEKTEGAASRGRPGTMWMGHITESSGFCYFEAIMKARDRNYWRQLIASVEPDDGASCRELKRQEMANVKHIDH